MKHKNTVVTIRNNFHNTSCRVVVGFGVKELNEMVAADGWCWEWLSKSQKRRVHKELCGQGTWDWPNCGCRSHMSPSWDGALK